MTKRFEQEMVEILKLLIQATEKSESMNSQTLTGLISFALKTKAANPISIIKAQLSAFGVTNQVSTMFVKRGQSPSLTVNIDKARKLLEVYEKEIEKKERERVVKV